jgi:hypothetical protein
MLPVWHADILSAVSNALEFAAFPTQRSATPLAAQTKSLCSEDFCELRPPDSGEGW